MGKLRKWRVSRIKGNEADEISTVEAANADAAVQKVAVEFEITDREQLNRLAVRPVE